MRSRAGIEAGGHSHADAAPLAILLTAVRAALPHGPPVVAAGGVATGAQVAALLALGAAGVDVPGEGAQRGRRQLVREVREDGAPAEREGAEVRERDERIGGEREDGGWMAGK